MEELQLITILGQLETEVDRLNKRQSNLNKRSKEYKINQIKLERIDEILKDSDKYFTDDFTQIPEVLSEISNAYLFIDSEDVDKIFNTVEKRARRRKRFSPFRKSLQIKYLKTIIEDLKKEFLEKKKQIEHAEKIKDFDTVKKLFNNDIPILEQRRDVIVYEILKRHGANS